MGVEAVLLRGDDLAKGWLLALLEDAPLDEAPAILAGDVARDGPRICEAVVRAVYDESDMRRIERQGVLEPLVSRTGDIAGARTPETAARAVDALRGVVWSALYAELARTDPDLLGEAGERLSLITDVVRGAVLRRWDNGEAGTRRTPRVAPLRVAGEDVPGGARQPEPPAGAAGPSSRAAEPPAGAAGPSFHTAERLEREATALGREAVLPGAGAGAEAPRAGAEPLGAGAERPDVGAGPPGGGDEAARTGDGPARVGIEPPGGGGFPPAVAGRETPARDALWIGALRDEIVRAGRARLPLTLLLVELEEADRVLAVETQGDAAVTFGRFAQAVRTAVRRRDVLACETDSRAWVIARDTGRAGAQALGVRIATAVPTEGSWRGAPLTVSVGLAVLGEDGHNAAALIDAAEQTKFAAEASGIGIVTDFPGEGGAEPPPAPGPTLVS